MRMKFHSDRENTMENTDEVPQVEDVAGFDTISTNPEEGDPSFLEDANLPTSLIITNLDVNVFNTEEDRLTFESLFREFDEEATFQYFKSFRRAKVNFCSSSTAARARIQLHQTQVCDKPINCYLAQPITPKDNGSHPYLEPPAPVKQFLISPPASPPVGWEPVDEGHPVINYDLLAAIASLSPGEAHELHPPSETQPGIVVHVCEENQEQCKEAETSPGKAKIVHTKCPERST